MKKKKIGKIIAMIISILVSIIFVGFFIFLAKMFFGDISISGNIIILSFALIIISIPLVVSIKILILMLTGKLKILTSIISELILMPLSVIYLFVAIFVIGIIASVVPVKDYHQYQKLYSSDNVLIKNFPSDIPNDAYDIKFYYIPSFLQKGKVMNLYYKVDDSTINEYIEKYKKIKLDTIERDRENLDELCLGEKIKINENYKLYFLYSECDNSGYCNHGSYSFVAINETSNECIFAIYEW